jgi:hypothetical protein
VGPRADLDAAAKRKSPCSCRESNPGSPPHRLVAILTGAQNNFPFFLSVPHFLSLSMTQAMRSIPEAFVYDTDTGC